MDFVQSILLDIVQGDRLLVALVLVLSVASHKIWLFLPFGRHLWRRRVPVLSQNHPSHPFNLVQQRVNGSGVSISCAEG